MTDASYDTILYEKNGPVATLTMNRPERMNSMNNRMLIETGRALTAAAEDPELRVLVLTGTGSRAFCPGADIFGVAAGSPDEDRLRPEHFRVPVQLRDLPAVTVAAVNGACAGAGLGWALRLRPAHRDALGHVQHGVPRRRGRRRHGRSVDAGTPGRPGPAPASCTSCPTSSTRKRPCASAW